MLDGFEFNDDAILMGNIHWQCLLFQQLSNHQLYDLLKLRTDVFVVEQDCAYPELDQKDRMESVQHLLGFQGSNLIAYARLLPAGVSYKEASIGRFVVAEAARRQGVGSLLMQQCLLEIERLWPQSDVRMSAQEYLQKFYSGFGFERVSDTYLEDGIPHIEMFRKAS